MVCKLCGGNKTEIIYDDYIRKGAWGILTKEKYKIYQCDFCKVIWHDRDDMKEFYESAEYRMEIEKAADIESYYDNHDREVLEKLQYTGTDIYRNKVVCDIGCGGGSFLNFVAGAAKTVVAIEPSEIYRKNLTNREYETYSYASEALQDWEGRIDVVTSFDVIEHVENPREFIHEIRRLLAPGGRAVIGTPTDAPVMRKTLGHEYEQFLFTYQHPWILSEESMKLICREEGIESAEIAYRQRYGIGNFASWLLNRKPKGDIHNELLSNTLNNTWKSELEQSGMADYMVLYIKK